MNGEQTAKQFCIQLKKLDENIGKIKLYTWRGHNYVENTESEFA